MTTRRSQAVRRAVSSVGATERGNFVAPSPGGTAGRTSRPPVYSPYRIHSRRIRALSPARSLVLLAYEMVVVAIVAIAATVLYR